MHRSKWHIGIDHAQGGLDHVAAIIDFRHDAVGLVLAVQCNRGLRPFGRRIMAGAVSQHIAAPSGVLAGDDNAGLIGVLAA